MDHRKLIQHGASSLTVALPSRWIKERGLKKGDTLIVDEDGNKVIFSTDESVKIEKISIDVTDLDRTSILLYIQGLYRFGYNEIEVHFAKQNATHYRKSEEITISSILHLVVGRLIGYEIVEQTSDRLIIKYLTRESDDDFKIILRRIFLLMNEASESLLKGIINSNISEISTIEDKHDNITKFISYALRLLNKYGYPDTKKTSFYHHIISSLDKMVDILKYNARDIIKCKTEFNKETISIWHDINKSIIGYYDLFYNFELTKVNELSRNRDKVKARIKVSLKKIPEMEIIYLIRMEELLEIILGLTEFRMGLEY